MTTEVTPRAGATPTEVHLHPDTLEQLAGRVAELLASELRSQQPAAPASPGRLLSAAEVSEWWGVERAWVYEHAEQLGAIRLGAGQRPRLRFDPDQAAAHLTALRPRLPERRTPRRHHARRSPRTPVDSGDPLPNHPGPELSSTKPTKGWPGGAPTPPATAPKQRPPAR
jgi:hypothetical protein